MQGVTFGAPQSGSSPNRVACPNLSVNMDATFGTWRQMSMKGVPLLGIWFT